MALGKDKEVGALWLKEAKSGLKYFSGNVTVGGQQIRVLIYKNTFKQEGENSPDYRMYVDDEEWKKNSPTRQVTEVAVPVAEPDDDVPF